MKIRIDFVTNSSSSSFIIAKRENFTQEQKDTIMSSIEKFVFGRVIAKNKEELDDYFLDMYGKDYKEFFLGMENEMPYKDYYATDRYVECLSAIEKGLVIYGGTIDFEYPFAYADFLTEIWESLETSNNEDFKGIETDLSY